ncbi:MAG: GNAT family N-acetyltransferase, partial [Rhodoglobus sp.]
MTVSLRGVEAADLDTVFEFERDPESVRMAAFTAADPDDRVAFDAHWAKILANPTVVARTILDSGSVAGTVASFVMEGEREVTYWIDRSRWGRGIASAALALLLAEITERPL